MLSLSFVSKNITNPLKNENRLTLFLVFQSMLHNISFLMRTQSITQALKLRDIIIYNVRHILWRHEKNSGSVSFHKLNELLYSIYSIHWHLTADMKFQLRLW